jgi:hypothetical protein
LCVIAQVCAEHPPNVPGRVPDQTGELPASVRMIRSSAAPAFEATVEAFGQGGRNKISRRLSRR